MSAPIAALVLCLLVPPPVFAQVIDCSTTPCTTPIVAGSGQNLTVTGTVAG